jgi:hypothetical protein
MKTENQFRALAEELARDDFEKALRLIEAATSTCSTR